MREPVERLLAGAMFNGDHADGGAAGGAAAGGGAGADALGGAAAGDGAAAAAAVRDSPELRALGERRRRLGATACLQGGGLLFWWACGSPLLEHAG
jgi:hypothetical protein